MRVGTALKRAILDNIYAQNAGRPVIDRGVIQGARDHLTSRNSVAAVLYLGRSAPERLCSGSPPFFAKTRWFARPRTRSHRTHRDYRPISGAPDSRQTIHRRRRRHQLLSEAGLRRPTCRAHHRQWRAAANAFRASRKLVIAHADGPRTVQMKGGHRNTIRAWNVDAVT